MSPLGGVRVTYVSVRCTLLRLAFGLVLLPGFSLFSLSVSVSLIFLSS